MQRDKGYINHSPYAFYNENRNLFLKNIHCDIAITIPLTESLLEENNRDEKNQIHNNFTSI